jgi:hypothetical protein
MPAKRFLVSGLVLAAMAAILIAKPGETPTSNLDMTTAAQQFLASLSEQQRAQATFAYDDAERLNWHFIPRVRKGLPLRDLYGDSAQAAQRLIASGLSKDGYDQALNIMSLDELLYLLEPGDRAERREKRDPKKYYLSIFGTPQKTGTWGWRVEGHHLSLNFSVHDGKIVASTPEFFGANPGYVNAGPGREIRVLGTEEDLARQILKLCSPEQQKVAWIDRKAPDDLRGGGKPQPETTAPVGIPASQMSADQKALLTQLLNEYLKNMPADVEKERRSAIEQHGIDQIYFAWWGEPVRNQPHYYRVQGPTFIIEYNNTQNSANHVHSMWRSLAGDFNIPLQK